MTTTAFILVLVSAVTHASWNFLLKTGGHKVAFLWSLFAVAFVAYLIPAAAFAVIDGVGWRGVAFGVVSGLIHGAYGLALARGYHLGDLSIVYPIARGMGPALIPIVAVLLLDETISIGGGTGIGLVVLGVLLTQGETMRLTHLLSPARALARPATVIALLTGALITTYSLWDKASLDHLPPVTLNQFSLAGSVLILAPVALQGRGALVAAEWRERWRSLVLAGLLAPLGYILVLVALTVSRVSYVAPAREVGIVLGALFGVVLLGEGYGAFRLAGSLLIVAGALTLGLSP